MSKDPAWVGPVGAHQARPVDGEAHRQLLDGDVVHHLVVAALQEGGIDGAERLHAVGREARGEGHRMLLGDADVEGALGEALAEQVQPGARGHGRGDGEDLVVGLGLADQRLGEDLGVAGRVALGLGLLAGDHVELGHRVVLVLGGLGRGIALALVGDHVHQHRAVGDVAHVLQHRHQVVHVVAVDRADVVEAQLLEEGAAGGHAAGVFLGLARGLLQRARQARRRPGGRACAASGRRRRTPGGPDRRSCRRPAGRSTCRCR